MPVQRPPCDHVLIVEDDLDLLNTLADLLKLEGVSHTQRATSLAEAEEALRSGFRPAAVILDLHLNGERGEMLLERLRADSTYAGVPILALSGDWLALAHLRGAVDRTLLKPTSPAGVVRALYSVCGTMPNVRHPVHFLRVMNNQPACLAPSDAEPVAVILPERVTCPECLRYLEAHGAAPLPPATGGSLGDRARGGSLSQDPNPPSD
ncbi:MAG TPA: response regulator [Anaeromyxobacter sp.]|nr:response regulator [Anaeromyxobacter sp.]